jgi:hypothetical protein
VAAGLPRRVSMRDGGVVSDVGPVVWDRASRRTRDEPAPDGRPATGPA